MRSLVRALSALPGAAHRRNSASRRTGRAVLSVLAAATMILTGLVLPATATAAPIAPMAAGDLATTVEWVDYVSGAPLDELQASVDSRSDGTLALVSLLIGYSCGPAACDNTTVQIAPMPLDPFYGTRSFATFSQHNLPTGATFAGSAAAGYTVGLGNLAPGSSGSFTVTYNYQSRPVGVSPQSFFPEGYLVPATAVISADGIEDYSATDQVTWHIDTPAPRVRIGDGGIARADQDYSYTLYMSASCQFERSTAGHGEPVYECAKSHTTTQTLPAEAVFVSATHDGQYDAATNSVSWTTSGPEAAIGWGPMGGLGQPRTVVVQFPASIVTDPVACVIDVSTQLNVDMTYLSGTEKSATTTATQVVNACEAFANASIDKTATRDAGTAGAPIVWANSNQYWNVRIANRSNVPGVTTITETFDQAGLRTYRVFGPVAETTVTLDNGDVVTTMGQYTAPTGRSIVAATVITEPLAGPNTVESDQSLVNYQDIRFYFTVEADVPADGYTRSNTATAVMEFPGTPELQSLDLGPDTQTVEVLRQPARLSPGLSSNIPGASSLLPGELATFTMSGATANVEDDVQLEPQYVFVAPAGWNIVAGSAAIAGLGDATFDYYAVTVNGEVRQAVFAQRPAGTVWGANSTWPTMTVQATPTAAAAAGSTSTAQFFQGDAAHSYGPNTAIWGNNGNFRYQDAADLDRDGVLTEYFAYANTNVRIGSTTALNVLKEICQPDATQADGCLWLSNPDEPVSVAPDTTGITYRVTVTNTGSSVLSNVVGYDVLPYPGDTGTSVFTAGTPRGSTFTEKVESISANSGVDLAFSASTNPCRDEVYPGAPACVNDWGTDAAGAQAIRMTVPGTLASGGSVSFSYQADVIGAPTAGAIACNSVAVDTASTPATEPRPVCAEVQEADLQATAPDSIDAQIDRPVLFPFTFANNGGTSESAATVTIDVPAGVTITEFAPAGWECTAPSAAPLVGPAEIVCTPTEQLALDAPLALELSGIVTAPDVEVTAMVTGPLYDRDESNNTAIISVVTTAAATGLNVTKSNGLDSLLPGSETSYTITVGNPLAFEALSSVSITDTLPAGTEFVSASDGGVFADGAVTWDVTAIEAGGSVTVTVTVLVADDAPNEITNAVTASAADPAFANETLSGTASDADTVERIALTKIGVLPHEAEPRAGDTVNYTFVATNTGGGVLNGVEMTDAMLGLTVISIDSWPTLPGILAPGESVTGTASYVLTQADVDAGTLSNTANVTSRSVEEERVTAEATEVLALPHVPALTLEKSATNTAVVAGDTVTFTLVATNTGNVTLSGVSLDDAMPGLSDISYSWTGTEGTLAPGESVTGTASYVTTQEDVDAGVVENSAQAVGTPPAGEQLTAEDAIIVEIPAGPELSLVKTAELEDTNGDGFANPGERISYSFEVTNTGNVTINNAVVNDPMVSGIATVDTLAPGETVTVIADDYTVTVSDAKAGEIVNVARVSGIAPDTTDTVSEESTATVRARIVPEVPSTPSEALPGTGFDLGGFGMLAGGSLLLGMGMLWWVSRRREDEVSAK